MDCNEIRDRLVEAAPETPEVARHLAACPDCRAHRDELASLGALLAAPPPTPAAVRADAFAACRAELAAEPSTRPRPTVQSQRVAVGALLATAGLVATGLVVAALGGDDGGLAAVRSVSVQVLVQNTAAALLAPALWPLLRRTALRTPSPRTPTGA